MSDSCTAPVGRWVVVVDDDNDAWVSATVLDAWGSLLLVPSCCVVVAVVAGSLGEEDDESDLLLAATTGVLLAFAELK